MASCVFLLFLLFLQSAAASDQISVKPGDDVILSCRADGGFIGGVEWTRTDLESKHVLFYRDGHSDTDNQHPSFKGRVQLVDSDLKDGDVSLILKNVNKNDRGTYECRVATEDSGLQEDPVRSIRLEVTDSEVISVKSGDDVTLSCQADGGSINAVEWTRADLDSEYVYVNIDGRSDPTNQHPSFEGRVQLVDSDLKNGDVSLILKKVTWNSRGTYECRVTTKGSELGMKTIKRIRLEVTEVTLVKLGDDVILTCWVAGGYIYIVKRTRTDLKSVHVLIYRSGSLDKTNQHPSFEGRVQLVDSDLKDGDVSLSLKNVNKNDRGTYECRVATGSSKLRRNPVRSFRLEVTDSDVTSVTPGDDIILPCWPFDDSITAVQWPRTGLKSNPENRHPSFEGRVQPVDSYLKTGDVSLILKNVNWNSRGTYECRVAPEGSGLDMKTIRQEVTDSEVISVKSGDDVILPCRADGGSITDVEWTRTEPSPAKDILRYEDGPSVSQHFLGRVQLVDSDLKTGDVSLILKNVNMDDTGTYECRVQQEGSGRRKRDIIDPEPIRRFRLEVTDSGGDHGWIAGGVVCGLLVVGVVVGLVLGLVRRSNRRREQTPNPPAVVESVNVDLLTPEHVCST